MRRFLVAIVSVCCAAPLSAQTVEELVAVAGGSQSRT